MKLTKTPAKGMKDILPLEMRLRDYAIRVIKEVYGSYGFEAIETPSIENIELLSSKQGGENEKLIFKILKRGEKLSISSDTKEEDIVDLGLRYDLTVPLCRYYANNSDKLPSPFKSLQIGSVWRADRPQKGRFRQFTQCDIDILGDNSILAETELLSASTTALGKLGFEDFKMHINDRHILRAISDKCGFSSEDFDKVCIILDKMDKIGLEGVAAELEKEHFAKESADAYLNFIQAQQKSENPLQFCRDELKDYAGEEVFDNLETIMSGVMACTGAKFQFIFDPTLVRGMSYYTGPIFEIEAVGFGSSIGGGGRYDNMIERFTGGKTPACGISIGFERIIAILLDKVAEGTFAIPDEKVKIAYLIDKNVGKDVFQKALEEAEKDRKNGSQVLMSMKNKNFKHQKETLEASGYQDFKMIYPDTYQSK